MGENSQCDFCVVTSYCSLIGRLGQKMEVVSFSEAFVPVCQTVTWWCNPEDHSMKI